MKTNNPTDYLGLSFEKKFPQMTLNNAQYSFMVMAERHRRNADLHKACYFMQTHLRKHDCFSAYVITKDAQKKIDNTPLDLKSLGSQLAGRTISSIYMPDKNEFIRFIMVNGEVAGIWVFPYIDSKGKATQKLSLFNFNIEADYTGEEIFGTTTTAASIRDKVVAIISFVELNTIEYEELAAPATRSATPQYVANALTSAGPTAFQVVDADWNVTKVRTSPSDVRGHLRNQRCGKLRQSIKQIWIADHQRSGYKRQAGKIRADK